MNYSNQTQALTDTPIMTNQELELPSLANHLRREEARLWNNVCNLKDKLHCISRVPEEPQKGESPTNGSTSSEVDFIGDVKSILSSITSANARLEDLVNHLETLL